MLDVGSQVGARHRVAATAARQIDGDQFPIGTHQWGGEVLESGSRRPEVMQHEHRFPGAVGIDPQFPFIDEQIVYSAVRHTSMVPCLYLNRKWPDQRPCR